MMSHFEAVKKPDTDGNQNETPDGRKPSFLGRLSGYLAGTTKRFCFSLAYVAVLVLLLGASLHYLIASRVNYQEARDNYLKAEIAKLDEQIGDVQKLRDQTRALLERKEIVSAILNNRRMQARVLDQLVCRVVPGGIYLTGIEKEYGKYTLHGVADSAASVTSLMNGVEKSQWLYSGKILRISEAGKPGGKGSSNAVSFDIETSSVPPQSPGTAPTAASPEKPPEGAGISNLAWFTPVVVVLLALCGIAQAWRWITNHAGGAKRESPGLGKLETLRAQLRAIQPKNVETWPRALRVIVLCGTLAILSAACWFVVDADYEVYAELVDSEDRLKQTFLEKKNMVVNLDLVKKSLLETQAKWGGVLRSVPDSREAVNRQFQEAIPLIQTNGLHLIDSRPAGGEAMRGMLARTSWSLKVSGSLDSIGHYLSDLARQNSSLSLQSYRLAAAPGAGNGGDMILEATMVGHRYLDADELAAQRKAASSPGAKK